MEVRDLLGGEAQTCSPTVTIVEAAARMTSEGVGSLGVGDSDALVGIVTERDVLRCVAADADPTEETVVRWMTPDPDSVEPDMTVDDAALWMVAAGYRHLPVVEAGRLLGIASIKDVLWAVTERHLQEETGS
jgi:CBS domain-containing protein